VTIYVVAQPSFKQREAEEIRWIDGSAHKPSSSWSEAYELLHRLRGMGAIR